MPFARYDLTATDVHGEVLAGATVEVRLEVAGAPLAPIYSDRDGTTSTGNPLTTDANGAAGFYVAGGFYKIVVTSGILTTTRRYIGIGMAQGSDDLATGLTERVVTASGVVTVTNDDADVILIKKATPAATRVVLPLSNTTTSKVRIADRKYDAATNNITVVPSRPNTFTVTSASPGVFTKTAHGLSVDQPISLETTGALYTGLAADTQYYVKTVPTADTFTIAATVGGAAINTSGSQSGVHTYGTDTIMGGASYVIDSNGASIDLKPLADGTGWI